MAKAIVKYNKDFKMWDAGDYPQESTFTYRYSGDSMPYAVKYDLNGDGFDDMVLAGHDNDSNMILELLSGTSGYYVRRIGESEPCYKRAREQDETLKLKPSHVLSLYKKGVDFAGLNSAAVNRFWRYNGDILIAVRPLNTCMIPLDPPETDSSGYCSIFQRYGGWQPQGVTAKEVLFIYGERDYSVGDDCNGGDCSLDITPSGSELR